MAQVFLTSHPTDQNAVRTITEYLKDNKIDFYQAEQGIAQQVIQKELRKASAFIYVISNTSATYPPARLQLRAALEQDLPVIPLVIDSRAPVLPEIQNVPVVNMTGGVTPTGLQQMIASIPRKKSRQSAKRDKKANTPLAKQALGQKQRSTPAARKLSLRQLLSEIIMASILVMLVFIGAQVTLNDNEPGPIVGEFGFVSADDVDELVQDFADADATNVNEDTSDTSNDANGQSEDETEATATPATEATATITLTSTLTLTPEAAASPTNTLTIEPNPAETIVGNTAVGEDDISTSEGENTATEVPIITEEPSPTTQPSPISETTDPSIPTDEPEPTDTPIAVSADNDKDQQRSALLFISDISGTDEVYISFRDGSEWVQLTDNDLIEQHISWSPDGTQVVFAAGLEGETDTDLYLLDVETLEQTLLVDSDVTDLWPAWAPNGQQIAFSSSRNGNRDLFLLDIATGEITAITTNPAEDFAPAWSPDGQQLVFTSRRDGNLELYLTNLDGSNETRLTEDVSLDDGQAQFSPDGTQIAFVKGNNDSSEIFLLATDTLELTQLTNFRSSSTFPTWSRDGQTVFFSIARGNSISIFSISAGGGSLQAVVGQTGSNEYLPRERP